MTGAQFDALPSTKVARWALFDGDLIGVQTATREAGACLLAGRAGGLVSGNQGSVVYAGGQPVRILTAEESLIVSILPGRSISVQEIFKP